MTRVLTFAKADISADKARNRFEAFLPLEAINVFARQMRLTYTNIDSLAEAIRARGQLQPGIAAALSRTEAVRYVRDLNQLWGTTHHIRDMRPVIIDGEKFYVILVAGHRRYRACERIAAGGTACRYFVELRFGMSSEDALSDQFTENMHEKVPPHEEAQSIHLGWLWMKKRHPDLTLTKFARSLNRSPDWVRGALRFVALPEPVQRFAYDGKLPYGVLLEFARLAETLESIGKPLPESQLMRFAERAMVEGQKAEDVRRIVAARITHEMNGQQSLFGDVEDRRPLRQVAARHLIRIIWENLEYLKAIQKHHADGGFSGESYFEPEYDPHVRDLYSPKSPVRFLSELLHYLVSEEKHLADLAQSVTAAQARTLRAHMKKLRRVRAHVDTLRIAEQAATR